MLLVACVLFCKNTTVGIIIKWVSLFFLDNICSYTSYENNTEFKSFPCWSFLCSSSRCTLRLHGSLGVASSGEKLFYPPSAQRACNHHSVCSCWTKWTEEYLKAYHWHCITQNSFCLCYVHPSLAPDPNLAWLGGHFARGELEEIVCSPSVCSPFKSLDVSVEQRSS